VVSNCEEQCMCVCNTMYRTLDGNEEEDDGDILDILLSILSIHSKLIILFDWKLEGWNCYNVCIYI
jgi:hypothetical protein